MERRSEGERRRERGGRSKGAEEGGRKGKKEEEVMEEKDRGEVTRGGRKQRGDGENENIFTRNLQASKVSTKIFKILMEKKTRIMCLLR